MKLYDLDKFADMNDGKCVEMNTHDRLSVRTAIWSARAPSKGTILLLQGRAEFIEKYYEVISELRNRGFSVATMDWRGQGGSERLLSDPFKGHVNRFDDYSKDLRQFIETHVLVNCPGPHFALTHSMGGLILLHELPKMRAIFERVLLLAPMIEIAQQQRRLLGKSIKQRSVLKTSNYLRLLGKGKDYVPGVNHTPFDKLGFPTNPTTSDGPRYDRNRRFLQDHPELAIAGPTITWLNEMAKAMRDLESSDFQSNIFTPTLIITASLDEIVDSRATEYFAKTLRAGHAISIPGSKHEILMERPPLRAQFWAAFDAFIPGSSA